MIDAENYRNNKITVYDEDGTVSKVYEGKMYIYYGDKIKDGCIHFADDQGHHHRIYSSNLVIIDEY